MSPVQVADRLSALDATFLYAESPRMPMHMGVLAVLDRLQVDHDEFMHFIERRSALEPRTRKRVVDLRGSLGRPVLVDDAHFEIRNHVHWMVAPRPYDDARALAFAKELMQQPLARDRPLWQLWTFEMTRRRTGMIACVHHCLADGIAGLGFAMAFLSPAPAPESIDEAPTHAGGAAPPTAIELLAGGAAGFLGDQAALARSAVRAVLPGGAALRTLAHAPAVAAGVADRAAQTSRRALFAPVGAGRNIATLTLALRDVKRIKDSHGCKVNDVMLAATTAGLRAALRAQGSEVENLQLTAAIPVNTRGADDSARTSVAQLVLGLPVSESEPGRRLEKIAGRTQALKSSQAAPTGAAMMRLANAAPPLVLRFASRFAASRAPADLLVTNVPGPREPLYLNGARLRAIHPFAPIGGTSAVSVAILSYTDRVCVGISADPHALPSLEPMVAGMRDEIQALLGGAR